MARGRLACLIQSAGLTVVVMSGLLYPTDARMKRLKPFFPKSHGMLRVDDPRVLR
jgi:hypothetical protein